MKNPKSEVRSPKWLNCGLGAVRRMWRVVRATPAQRVAVDAVLGTGKAESRKLKAEIGGGADGARFDEVERVLSLALDAVVNAVDSYRERKKGGL